MLDVRRRQPTQRSRGYALATQQNGDGAPAPTQSDEAETHNEVGEDDRYANSDNFESDEEDCSDEQDCNNEGDSGDEEDGGDAEDLSAEDELLFNSIDDAIAAINRRGIDNNDFRGLVKYGGFNSTTVYLR